MTLAEKIKRAKELRKAAIFGAAEFEDKKASEVTSLFGKMEYNGELLTAGTRICRNGFLYKAAADLWDREENSPENAPNLWREICFYEGTRIIPEVITAEEAFKKGEAGYWELDGKIYKSLIDANVHTPDAYPEGWEEVL